MTSWLHDRTPLSFPSCKNLAVVLYDAKIMKRSEIAKEIFLDIEEIMLLYHHFLSFDEDFSRKSAHGVVMDLQESFMKVKAYYCEEDIV